MPADPHGAALIAPTPVAGPASGRSGWFGKYGARCARTPIGPTPGPPPPCGMQNVLCKFRCDTSAPNWPGRATPTSALRFAPSRYTWPPFSCTTAQISRICSSNTPCVDGYVTINAPRRSACSNALLLEIVEVDVAVVVARDNDHSHAGHCGRRGIRAVRRRRDQAHIAFGGTLFGVELANREQARVLALRTGVGL